MSGIRKILMAAMLAFMSFAAFAVPVDINSADAQTLAKALSGVGPSKAEAIVAYRQQHGPFKQVSDLLQVKGIGSSILEKNRDAIRLQPVTAQ